jgi:hypothetical protein
MMAMALILLAVADPPVILSAVRLEAEGDRPVVRAVVTGPVPARVERDGRDLILVLPGARAADGLVLPQAVAEVVALALEQTAEGVRVRVRLESALPFVMSQEGGVVSVTIRATQSAAPATTPSPAPHVKPDSVRDLYARIVPPAENAPPAPAPSPAAGDASAPAAKVDDSGSMRLGFFRFRPWVAISYVDAKTSLETPEPVRDKYLEIDPHLGLGLGASLPLPGQGRLVLSYEPRFRLSSSFEELSHPTHLATGTANLPIGAFAELRGSYHYANGLLETTEVDPGREYFFRLAPFVRNQIGAGATANPGGLLNLDVDAMRDSVQIDDTSGFFDHRTETIGAKLNYQFGAASRAFLSYGFSRVPPSDERPIVESQASTVGLGVSGELTPLLTADVTLGFTSLSAPQAGEGGKTYRGSTLAASVRKEFTPSASVTLLATRGTYPSGFEENAFYVASGAGVATDLGLPFSFVFHASAAGQVNSYRVIAAGLDVPRRDEIWDWSAGLGRALTRWAFLRADYRRERRNSNLPAFQTHGHLFMVQLGIGFLGATPTGTATR